MLARFAKTVFSAESIRDYATQLRYTAQMANFLRRELDLKDREPSEYFIRWMLKADHMYDGVVNANVLERFKPIAKDALTRVIREIVRRSISAMEQEAARPADSTNMPTESQAQDAPEQQATEAEDENKLAGQEARRYQIETTERELRVFEIVKELFESSPFAQGRIFDGATRKEIPIEIGYKDTTGYFGIYFNKPSWWIMRVAIEGRTRWAGFNIEDEVGGELIPGGMTKLEAHPYASFRVKIAEPADLCGLASLVLAAFEKTISDRTKGTS